MVFEGTAELEAERMFPDLLAKGVPGADKVTLDEFKHWASLVWTHLGCLLPAGHPFLQQAHGHLAPGLALEEVLRTGVDRI